MAIPDDQLETLFTMTLDKFLANESGVILDGINERNNCARFAHYLQNAANQMGLNRYFADAEYNRNQGKIKTILDGSGTEVTINCDVILHSRGQIEMKKSDRPAEEKVADRKRLQALTKSSFDDVWVSDGITLPKHVCGYRLGAFVELDRVNGNCHIEFFKSGHSVKTECKEI
jgi:hypothetical protein